MQLPNIPIDRKPYEGTVRKLIIALDVGTTFSGASYALLDPGEVPITQPVTSFPGQSSVGGSAKIPSIICYDKEGKVRAVGSEALEPGFLEEAEDEGYVTSSWFKLHLRPASMPMDFEFPPLPDNKTALVVFSDFLRYLYECTKSCIRKMIGDLVWTSVQHNIDFILSHPNGWEIIQQAQMREAAILAGLVSKDESHDRVHFVTEGEATLHFCIHRKIPFSKDEGIIIVDAGGGTVDLSAYHQTALGSFEEIGTCRCIAQGSVFPISGKLKDSRYGSKEDIDLIASKFDSEAKHTFRRPDDPVFIRFGSSRDRDPTVDIKSGQLKLPGQVVQTFFEPSIEKIIQAIREQRREATTSVRSVFLAGGFAASDWLFSRLENELEPEGLIVSRPDAHLNKAVADGALSYYLDHFVSARKARFTFGTNCSRRYDPWDSEHLRRERTVYTSPSGVRRVPKGFRPIIAKVTSSNMGTLVNEETEFRKPFVNESYTLAACKSFSVEIMVYRGALAHPEWTDTEARMFSVWGSVEAHVSDAVVVEGRRNRQRYFIVHYEIILLFGGPEIKAQICWQKDIFFTFNFHHKYSLPYNSMQSLNTLTNRKPYDGTVRKLIIAFDVGTTFSGASYALLDPGEVPITQPVTSFPGQSSIGGSAKIPSIICYDKEGKVRAVGSEALEPGFLEEAEDKGYVTSSWFKLHLRPASMPLDLDIPPLPNNKTPLVVFSDFLRYLYECTKSCIQKTIGDLVWNSVQFNIDFILSHPNGWEMTQQAQMRQAAILAGLVYEDESQERVHFVTEGEATLHFCIHKQIPFKKDKGIIIVDAGGGTVDLSAYRQTAMGSFEEIGTARCIEKLKDSLYGGKEDVDLIASKFDTEAKHTFRRPDDPVFVRFGSSRDRDLTVDIKLGQLKLPGQVVETFFEPSIRKIIQAIREQRQESTTSVQSVFLAGGFAASDWLLSCLKNELESEGLFVSRPDAHLNKAVADGALSYYLDRSVTARKARFTFGKECGTPFRSSNNEHMLRQSTVYQIISGRRYVPKSFDVILPKGTLVNEETEFRRRYTHWESYDRSIYKSSSRDIIVYRGESPCPEWTDTEPRMFSILGTVYADISDAVEIGGFRKGRTYYTADYEVIILFGGPEIKAQISWKKNGKEYRSPATIICEPINQSVK
ncbi:hypothetical protein FB446DRAFT_791054 [Lentinula raphanica]|nr:hypothetical protein FB446DRAFT_791054 [Lentinula raphanica]